MKRLILCFFTMFSHSLFAATWSGVSVANVTDEDLLIDGSCTFSDNRYIYANTQDVTVTVANTAVVNGGAYILELITESSREITFDITDSSDLAFAGSTSGFFQIIQRGPGAVRWIINGGRSVILRNSESEESGDRGVRYFISMENATDGTVIQRGDNTALHAAFKILNDSMLTFIAPTLLADSPTEQGALVFDTQNTNATGRTYVEIGDSAGFIISGHYVENLTDPDNVAVHLDQPAGLKPIIELKAATDDSAYANTLIINKNINLPELYVNPTRNTLYTGEQSGFVLGTNSYLNLKNNTYLDFIGTTTNIDPWPSTAAVLGDRIPEEILKSRNASAFFVDGAPTGTTGAVDAQIEMEGDSGVFFRSGCDKDGDYTEQSGGSFCFLIDPVLQPLGAGNIVFDVEGKLNITGASDGTNIINIVSRQVDPTGGKIEIGVGETKFPKITFADDDDGDLLQYAKGCMMVNNRCNFTDMIVRHDDFFHEVNATNTPQNSDPTYIGGETFKLVTTTTIDRPRMVLYNSSLNLHTNAAFTGVDLYVPNFSTATANQSYLKFYQNGRVIDKGTGRALILGTTSGSYAMDYASIVDAATYLDIQQEVNQTSGADYTHQLDLVTAVNDSTVIEGAPDSGITDQYSIHTIFLGNESNIQIGSQEAPSGVTLNTLPKLYINGNFFSFMSQGGTVGDVELSGTIGQGGIFVDINGTISIATTALAHMGMMVTTNTLSSTVELPKSRINFGDNTGVTKWNLNLANEQTVITATQNLSDFTIDWKGTSKDYSGGFVPFNPIGSLGQGVESENLYHIPEIKGTVDELQIKRTRIGDPVHVVVDGGLVRDLLFLKGYDSAEAPTGLIALKNDGKVGIGNNNTRADAIDAAVVLGINGVMLVADGSGVVTLNSDIDINNYCHIMAGPNFGQSGKQELFINAEDSRILRVKRGGVLDLSTFTSDNMRIVFGGEVKLIFEPGSKFLMGGGTMFFTNEAELHIQNEIESAPATGTSVTSTDDFRVVFVGGGKIIFDEDAKCVIEKDAYLGFEWQNLYRNITSTDFEMYLRDNASFQIGTESMWGGAVQIGNTSDLSSNPVRFSLELNGPDALFEINGQGFFGIGVGIVDKHQSIPNDWLVGSLYNVAAFTLNITQGIIKHNAIFTGASKYASLLAVGPATTYSLSLPDATNFYTFSSLGGGNMIRLGEGVTSVNPIVTTIASSSVGIYSSTDIIRDNNNLSNIAAAASGTSVNFFNVFASKEVTSMASPAASLARITLGNNQLAYVYNNVINRKRWIRILGAYGDRVVPDYSLRIGAVGINVTSETGLINNAVQILR
jgi:hypothetical protein